MPEIEIGGSPRNATTDRETGLRTYRWDDEHDRLISSTTVRRAAGIPFGLHNWAIGQVIDHAISNVADFQSRLQDDPDNAQLALIRSELRKASTAERDRAAALGTAVHDAAATGALPDAVAPDLRPRLAQYHDWLKTSGAGIVAAEFQVWNLTVGYAGTVDLLVQMRNGRTIVVDIKTGKGIYNDHVLQLASYKHAEFVGNDGKRDEWLTEWLTRADGAAILHLADDGWEFVLLKPDAIERGWRAFRGLHLFAGFVMDYSDPATFTEAKREGHAEPVAEVAEAAPVAPVEPPSAPQAPEVAPVPAAPGPASPAAIAELQAAGEAVFAELRQGSALSREQFKEMIRVMGADPALVLEVARGLYPAQSDMRQLSDAERGGLYDAVADRHMAALAAAGALG